MFSKLKCLLVDLFPENHPQFARNHGQPVDVDKMLDLVKVVQSFATFCKLLQVQQLHFGFVPNISAVISI